MTQPIYNALAVGDRMNIQSQAPENAPIEKEIAPLVEEKQTIPHQFYPQSYYNATALGQTPRQGDKPRILGFRPPAFWLSLLLSILLVAGAIGGGIGGFALKNSSKASSKYALLDSIFCYD